MLENSQDGRALIFGGVQGIGKASAAREIVQHFLPQPAQQTTNLLWIGEEDSHQEMTIDTIRQAKDFLHYTSDQALYRIVVIDNANLMNVNAANALLKTLEEPPEQSLLILIAHQPFNLLQTIQSRCLMIHFMVPANSTDIVAKHLEVTSHELRDITRLARHIPGIAITLHKMAALDFYNEMITSLLLALKKNNLLPYLDFTQKLDQEKWWLFSYLLEYLIEKTIRYRHSGNIEALSKLEQQLCDLLLSNFSNAKLFAMRDEIQKFVNTTTSLYLDHKSVAITLLQFLYKDMK